MLSQLKSLQYMYHTPPNSSISMCESNPTILFYSLDRSRPCYLLSLRFSSRICPGYSSQSLRSGYPPELAFSVENVSQVLRLFQPYTPSCLSFNRLMLSRVPVTQDHLVPIHDESPQLHSPSPFVSWLCV